MSALVLPERREDRLALLALLKEKERRESRRKLWTYFPDTGPLRRELYQLHLEFFRLGATVFIALEKLQEPCEAMGTRELALTTKSMRQRALLGST